VQRAGNQIPNYKETQNYVKTVMQLYTMLKPPAPVRRAPAILSRVRPTAPAAPPSGVAQSTAATCLLACNPCAPPKTESETPDALPATNPRSISPLVIPGDDSLNLASYAQRAYLEYAL
jgi:hypothetical protein